ncbi:MAG: DNA polymerase III subunit delta [Coriobacteriia bacterium]|nr:DNA polymerase III subunit delta [Coriobacteriia bacterium]
MAAPDLSDLKPVYLIHGPEELLLEQAVERLKRRLSALADLDFNLDVFDGDTALPEDVIAAANTLPFMSDRRLVILRKADRMSADALGILADYAADPNPDTTLVLVASKIARNLRIFKKIDALGGVAEYKAPAKRDYARTVVGMFADRGKRVGLDAAEVLVRAVGYDLRRLSVEIDKAISFTGDEATLSRDEIEQVMSTTAPTSIFDFLDALGSRNCRDAMRLLSALLDEGESIHGVHAMSVRHIRNLLSARALLERDEDGSVTALISREIGVREWQARNIATQARRFSSEELVGALLSAAESEARMKTSRDPRLVFEIWVLEVCGR